MRRVLPAGVIALAACTSSSAGGVALGMPASWGVTTDAQPAATPVLNVIAIGSDSVTVKSTGGPDCGCNAVTGRLALGRSVPCTATLELDWATGGEASEQDSMGLDLRFLKAGAQSEPSWTKDGFLGGSFAGRSACAVRTGGTFPRQARLNDGHHVIKLSALDPKVDGQCTGAFDTLEVHVQRYGCTPVELRAVLSHLVLRP